MDHDRPIGLQPPVLEFLFEVRVELGIPPLDVGAVPNGRRLIYFVKGGEFEGPSMRGTVIPESGADWVLVNDDGTSQLDVRFALKTDDDAILYVTWVGRFTADPDNAAYARNFEKADDPAGADRYYFRAAPCFEVADPRYKWLNDIISVTRSRTGEGGVIHRIYVVR